MHAARASAASAASPSINSAGTSICGTNGPTSGRRGIAPALLRGNSGVRQANRRHCCGDFRRVAAAKRAAASGKMPKWIIEYRSSASGMRIGIHPGRTCSTIGVCRTSRSSIAMLTSRNVPTKPAIEVPGVRRKSTPPELGCNLVRIKASRGFGCAAPLLAPVTRRTGQAQAPIAALVRSPENGKSRRRLPVASAIALASEAAAGPPTMRLRAGVAKADRLARPVPPAIHHTNIADATQSARQILRLPPAHG